MVLTLSLYIQAAGFPSDKCDLLGAAISKLKESGYVIHQSVVAIAKPPQSNPMVIESSYASAISTPPRDVAQSSSSLTTTSKSPRPSPIQHDSTAGGKRKLTPNHPWEIAAQYWERVKFYFLRGVATQLTSCLGGP